MTCVRNASGAMTKIVQGTRVQCAGPTRPTTEKTFLAADSRRQVGRGGGHVTRFTASACRNGRAPNTRKMVVLPKQIIV